MQREVILERFFNALISGNRTAARQIVDELLEADCPAQTILSRVFWPTLEHIQNLHRNDQLSDLAHHFATRLMRMLADQMQLRLIATQRRDKTVQMACGPDEPVELGAQMAAELLEADGSEGVGSGGGFAKDVRIGQSV
jgi:methanogenic corrinoid protein MtbC1